MNTEHPTLTRDDYLSDEIYELERSRIFHRGWFYALRSNRLLPGNRTIVDIAGESVLMTRDLDGELHAFANVCRHRGARLCDGHDTSGQGSLMCPYHAWTFALDGRLIATPHLDAEEVDKSLLPLWSHHVREWDGFTFVSVAADPVDFDEWLATDAADLLALRRFDFGRLATVSISDCEVAANWKIVVENYQECLHCTRVHPELVSVIPIYRTGAVVDATRSDGGVAIADGVGYGFEGAAAIPPLTGISETDATSYFGGTIFPNMFIDVSGNSVVVTRLAPLGVARTAITMEFLFDPEAVAATGFDPAPIVRFNELVAAQDNVVCERVQLGVASRSFSHGVLTSKDQLVIDFDARYLAARDRAGDDCSSG